MVSYDLPGSGLSDRTGFDFTLAGHVEDLSAVINATGFARVALVGVATSCPVVAAYAAQRSERVTRIVMMNGWVEGADYTRSPMFESYRKTLEGDWSIATESMARMIWGAALEEAEVIAADIRDAVDQDTYLAYLDAVTEHDARGAMSSLSLPALVVHADGLPLHRREFSRDIAATIPGAELHEHFREIEAVRPFLRADESGRGESQAGLQIVLFTDLAGSTAMQSRLGDEGAMKVLRAHDAAVRQAIEEFNGREVKHTGDGMMTAFGSAADAVNCALTVRRDIATYNDTHEGEELLVRFGLNAGEPIAEDDDLFGLSVTLAARIGDWGEPGQVLCSRVVRDLLLGKSFEFTSVGSAELKGLDDAVPLFEVRSGERPQPCRGSSDTRSRARPLATERRSGSLPREQVRRSSILPGGRPRTRRLLGFRSSGTSLPPSPLGTR